MNRREFLSFCAKLSLLFTGSTLFTRNFANAFNKIAKREIPVIWIQGQACTGDSISLLYGDSPSIVSIISEIINLRFHPNISAAQGDVVKGILKESIRKSDFILCVEGSVPYEMPDACKIGEETFSSLLKKLITASKAVVLVGTCASYGGIPASNEETGAISVVEFMQRHNLNKPYIRLPGCPTSAHRIAGTVAYTVAFGKLPSMDSENRVKLYYPDVIHNNCQRFRYFSEDKYVEDYNNKRECLFKMGCRGPITYADCPLRRWNRNTSWCVDSNTPCIGCAHEKFPYNRDQSIYTDPKKINPKEKIIL